MKHVRKYTYNWAMYRGRKSQDNPNGICHVQVLLVKKTISTSTKRGRQLDSLNVLSIDIIDVSVSTSVKVHGNRSEKPGPYILYTFS